MPSDNWDLDATHESMLVDLVIGGVERLDVTFVSEDYEPGRVYRGIGSWVKMVPGYDYIGEFVAFNPVTGQRAWEYRSENGAAMTASALATAGGIVFGGTADRRFFALDANNGDVLWETRLNGDISGAPVTFEVDGR